jgi:hypothetical protein
MEVPEEPPAEPYDELEIDESQPGTPGTNVIDLFGA